MDTKRLIVLAFALCLSALSWSADLSKIDPNKFTVCAITINSDDEKKIFEEQVRKRPTKFNPIVELTEFGDKDTWFKKACDSSLRCDQLIISGHFGGRFFSEDPENELSLTLKEIEAAGCSKSCEGVLSQPHEVFLFGCNTLAEKQKDARTPQEYLQILLRDGIPAGQAELVVQSRYGDIGDTNKAGMRRAFSGEKKHIYGFYSIGPSGKTSKPFLDKYFSEVDNLERLEKLQAERMMEKVVSINETIEKVYEIADFTQCGGADHEDETTKDICRILDAKADVNERLQLTTKLLGSADYLTYLPSINTFLEESSHKFTDEQKKTLSVITKNEVLKSQILELVRSTDGLGLKAELVSFANRVGFLTEAEGIRILAATVEKMLSKPLTIFEKDMICSFEGKEKLQVSEKNIKYKKIGKLESEVYDCLKIQDSGFRIRVQANFLVTKDPKIIDHFLSLIIDDQDFKISDPRVIRKMESLLKSSPEEDKWVLMAAFATESPENSVFQSEILKGLTSKDDLLRSQCLEGFVVKNGADPTAQLRIAKYLTDKNKGVRNIAFSGLLEMKPKDQQVKKMLEEAYKTKQIDHYDPVKVKSYFQR